MTDSEKINLIIEILLIQRQIDSPKENTPLNKTSLLIMLENKYEQLRFQSTQSLQEILTTLTPK